MVASMTVAVMWGDGVVTMGDDATDVLETLCGGWNPNTVIELRGVLARRARIEHDYSLSDDAFLQRLDSVGVLTLQYFAD